MATRIETGHFDRMGVMVWCILCSQMKAPRGRDAPHYRCDRDRCRAWNDAPRTGSLFPGELALDFGSQVGPTGTKIVWVNRPEGDDDDE